MNERTPQQVYEQALAVLKPQQRRFVVEYLQCLKGAEAVRRSGSKSKRPQQQAYEYLTKPDIKIAIAAGMALQVMGPSEVLARLSDQAQSTADDILAIERVKHRDMIPVSAPTEDDPQAVKYVEGPEYEVVETRIDLEKAKRNNKLHLIKKVGYNRYGIQIELYSAYDAQVKLGEHYGLFGKKDDILKYLDLSKLSPAQLERLAQGDDPVAVLLAP